MKSQSIVSLIRFINILLLSAFINVSVDGFGNRDSEICES